MAKDFRFGLQHHALWCMFGLSADTIHVFFALPLSAACLYNAALHRHKVVQKHQPRNKLCELAFQVKDKHGTWIDVHAPKSSLVVLAGYTLERATCRLIKASRHRVVGRSYLLLSLNALDPCSPAHHSASYCSITVQNQCET